MELKIGKKKPDTGFALRYAITHIFEGRMETINVTVDDEKDLPKLLTDFVQGSSVLLSVVRTR